MVVTKTSRERSRGRSRRQILLAARELVLESGADKLSLRAVAARADYSPASLYEYFESKEDLVLELAVEVMTRLYNKLAQVPSSLPPARRLVRYALSYVSFARENPQDFLLLFAKLRSPRSSETEEPSQGSPYLLILEAARAGLGDGSFAKTRTAQEIAYGTWGIAHGLAMLQITHLSSFAADFESGDQKALEAYVAGLTKGT